MSPTCCACCLQGGRCPLCLHSSFMMLNRVQWALEAQAAGCMPCMAHRCQVLSALVGIQMWPQKACSPSCCASCLRRGGWPLTRWRTAASAGPMQVSACAGGLNPLWKPCLDSTCCQLPGACRRGQRHLLLCTAFSNRPGCALGLCTNQGLHIIQRRHAVLLICCASCLQGGWRRMGGNSSHIMQVQGMSKYC